MKPISFNEQNIVYTKPESMTDDECCSLPAHRHDQGILSCWKMTFKERLLALFNGKVWLNILSTSQPPVWLALQDPFVDKKGGE